MIKNKKQKKVLAKVKKVFKYSFSNKNQRFVKVGEKVEMPEDIYKCLKKEGFVE
ncbi:MAG: hypothetical protein JSU91_01905 [Thermoplasmatales archaeon]|nr:MAG: hypothetical protein JSU91_01905 [Thermoplasmatales archaeon]